MPMEVPVARLLIIFTVCVLCLQLARLEREHEVSSIIKSRTTSPRRTLLRQRSAQRKTPKRSTLAGVPIVACRSLLLLSGRLPSAAAVDALSGRALRRHAGLVVRLNTRRGASRTDWMTFFASATPPSARLLLARGAMGTGGGGGDATRGRLRTLPRDEIYAAARVELRRLDVSIGKSIADLSDDDVDAVVDVLGVLGPEGVALFFSDSARPHARHAAAAAGARGEDTGLGSRGNWNA